MIRCQVAYTIRVEQVGGKRLLVVEGVAERPRVVEADDSRRAPGRAAVVEECGQDGVARRRVVEYERDCVQPPVRTEREPRIRGALVVASVAETSSTCAAREARRCEPTSTRRRTSSRRGCRAPHRRSSDPAASTRPRCSGWSGSPRRASRPPSSGRRRCSRPPPRPATAGRGQAHTRRDGRWPESERCRLRPARSRRASRRRPQESGPPHR